MFRVAESHPKIAQNAILGWGTRQQQVLRFAQDDKVKNLMAHPRRLKRRYGDWGVGELFSMLGGLGSAEGSSRMFMFSFFQRIAAVMRVRPLG